MKKETKTGIMYIPSKTACDVRSLMYHKLQLSSNKSSV